MSEEFKAAWVDRVFYGSNAARSGRLAAARVRLLAAHGEAAYRHALLEAERIVQAALGT